MAGLALAAALHWIPPSPLVMAGLDPAICDFFSEWKVTFRSTF